MSDARITCPGGVGSVEFCYQGGDESDIIRAARMSTDKGFQGWDLDKRLLSYLYAHHHSTPFEFVVFCFEIEAPIFVARQIFRHRTFTFNELSGRYSEIDNGVYQPVTFRVQSTVNKQGSAAPLHWFSELASQFLSRASVAQFTYKGLLALGVSKEQARYVLPVSTVTRWRMIGNLRNWIHFLKLRCDGHAQHETRMISNAIAAHIISRCPHVAEVANLSALVNPG